MVLGVIYLDFDHDDHEVQLDNLLYLEVQLPLM